MMSGRQVFSYMLVRSAIRALMLVVMRTTVRGLEHLPKTGAAILVCNHIAAIDPAVLVGVLPRPITLMSKVENARGALRPFMRMVGAFTVRRGTADRRALELSRRVLEAGRLLCIFPEGTRSRTRALQPGRGGAALLALQTGAPIVPIGITGTQYVFMASFPWLGHPHVTVTIGCPFTPEPAAHPFDHEARRRLTEEIMARIAALLPPEQRGAYVLP